MAAATAASLLAVYAAVASSAALAPVFALTLLAVVALAAGLVADQPAAIGAAIVLLALEFAFLPANSSDPSPATAAVYGGGLVLVAEFTFWSRTAGLLTPCRRRIIRKALTTLVVALAAAALAALVAEGARAPIDGAWLEPLGIAAAVIVALLLVVLAPTSRRPGNTA